MTGLEAVPAAGGRRTVRHSVLWVELAVVGNICGGTILWTAGSSPAIRADRGRSGAETGEMTSEKESSRMTALDRRCLLDSALAIIAIGP